MYTSRCPLVQHELASNPLSGETLLVATQGPQTFSTLILWLEHRRTWWSPRHARPTAAPPRAPRVVRRPAGPTYSGARHAARARAIWPPGPAGAPQRRQTERTPDRTMSRSPRRGTSRSPQAEARTLHQAETPSAKTPQRLQPAANEIGATRCGPGKAWRWCTQECGTPSGPTGSAAPTARMKAVPWVHPPRPRPGRCPERRQGHARPHGKADPEHGPWARTPEHGKLPSPRGRNVRPAVALPIGREDPGAQGLPQAEVGKDPPHLRKHTTTPPAVASAARGQDAISDCRAHYAHKDRRQPPSRRRHAGPSPALPCANPPRPPRNLRQEAHYAPRRAADCRWARRRRPPAWAAQMRVGPGPDAGRRPRQPARGTPPHNPADAAARMGQPSHRCGPSP